MGFKRVCAERTSDYRCDVFGDRGTLWLTAEDHVGACSAAADQKLSNFERRGRQQGSGAWKGPLPFLLLLFRGREMSSKPVTAQPTDPSAHSDLPVAVTASTFPVWFDQELKFQGFFFSWFFQTGLSSCRFPQTAHEWNSDLNKGITSVSEGFILEEVV